ncbi:hypothetical protein IJ00_07065 [Calothrix sp. 336/3]|nr:hypothetical protein IJ00_07065 [Calothrix sp. 336/3]
MTLSQIKNLAFLMGQKSYFFGKYFFSVTDFRSIPKTQTIVLQWFQRRILGFIKMDKVEITTYWK